MAFSDFFFANTLGVLGNSLYFQVFLSVSTYMLTFLLIIFFFKIKKNKLGARTLGARSRGSKNVTYRQQTTDKKVNTEPL